MSSIRHFRYAPHGKGGKIHGMPIAGHHAVYSSLVEIKTKRKKAAQPEYLLSCAVADYLAILERQGRIVDYFHVPNGGQRHAVVAEKLKRMGVRAGVSDFVIRGKVGGRVAFMELKIGKGRESPAQVEFRTRGTKAGHVHFICRDLDDVKRAVETFLRNTEILFGGFREGA